MDLPKRKPTRLKNYDYSQNGYYFITICTKNKDKIFGNIVGGGAHDHIIRGEKDYLKIWNYIDTNPQKWEEDCFYTE